MPPPFFKSDGVLSVFENCNQSSSLHYFLLILTLVANIDTNITNIIATIFILIILILIPLQNAFSWHV